MNNNVGKILELYEKRKGEIKERLREFKELINQDDERIFSELAFCILTPQSKAKICWDIVKSLERSNLLLSGTREKIRPFLNAVRFGDNKAKYLVNSREFFIEDGRINIKRKLLQFKNNPTLLREWLIKNIKGLGMKESSHFIRNIGLSNNQLAILDVHILRNLVELNVIKEVPRILTKKMYLNIESKMKKFADELGISLDELDLLLWSKETGIIFK